MPLIFVVVVVGCGTERGGDGGAGQGLTQNRGVNRFVKFPILFSIEGICLVGKVATKKYTTVFECQSDLRTDSRLLMFCIFFEFSCACFNEKTRTPL